MMKKYKQKQSEIKLSIEKRTFLEQQLHTFRFVWALVHRRRFALPATHKKHLKPRLLGVRHDLLTRWSVTKSLITETITRFNAT